MTGTRLFEAKPFIIAEVGSNNQGLDDCLRSIEVAADCGASAAKFQIFDSESLYGCSDIPVRGSIHPLWLPRLSECALAHGIEFMCSAFSPELVAAVDPFVSVHKVASAEAAWPQLLDAVKATGKPVLVSVGAKTEQDRFAIARAFQDCPARVIAMACTAAYPADYSPPTRYGGYSDHTLGYTAAVAAGAMGVPVIEKHFTAFPDLETPDRQHSLTPKQFKRMVDLIRGREVETEEGEMFARHNRRLLAIRDVSLGQTLRYGDTFGAYRSLVDDSRGLSPFAWDRVEGKAATRPIARGEAIGEGDFA